MATTKRALLTGIKDSIPFVLVVAPFALLFGVVASEAGLTVTQSLGFSIVVIAGASQLAAVQLMAENAPTLIIIATALTINFRMAMYSASLAPYLRGVPLWKRAVMSYLLVDQTYALSLTKYETEPQMSNAAKAAYYLGTMVFITPAWYGFTVLGAVSGAKIPPEFALDFALPIAFLAMIAPMLKTPAHVAAALTSVLVALLLAFIPYNLGLLIAAVCAMIVGAQIELMLQRGKK